MLPTAHYSMGGIPTNLHGEALHPTAGYPERTVPRDGRVRLGDRPVHLVPLSNEVPAFPPSERVY